jgi:hypothetical protein
LSNDSSTLFASCSAASIRSSNSIILFRVTVYRVEK